MTPLPKCPDAPPRRSSTHVPTYSKCRQCGEDAQKTLRKVSGRVLCENCRELARIHALSAAAAGARSGARRGVQPHPIRPCAICRRTAPSELHHVASARQHPTLTLPVCLNCHRLLSLRQGQWHPAWKSEAHPWRYLVQGVYDVLCLWRERSPIARDVLAHCYEVLTMLAMATLYGMTALCPSALGELRFLVHWGAL